MTTPKTKVKTVKIRREKPYQLYGFILMVFSGAIFIFLLLLPLLEISPKCKILKLEIGGGSYPYPIVLLAVGMIIFLDIGPALVNRFIAKKN